MSLGFVNFVEFFDGFEFEACPELNRRDDFAFDDEIGFEFANLFAKIKHRQAFLVFEGDATFKRGRLGERGRAAMRKHTWYPKGTRLE